MVNNKIESVQEKIESKETDLFLSSMPLGPILKKFVRNPLPTLINLLIRYQDPLGASFPIRPTLTPIQKWIREKG